MNTTFINYCKNCIKNGTWSVGHTIDSITKLSTTLPVTRYKAKLFIDYLINIGVVDKYYNRFYLISLNFNQDTKSVQDKLIHKAKINIQILKLINDGACLDTKYLSFTTTTTNQAVISFPLRKKRLKLTLNDIGEQTDEINDILKRQQLL